MDWIFEENRIFFFFCARGGGNGRVQVSLVISQGMNVQGLLYGLLFFYCCCCIVKYLDYERDGIVALYVIVIL